LPVLYESKIKLPSEISSFLPLIGLDYLIILQNAKKGLVGGGNEHSKPKKNPPYPCPFLGNDNRVTHSREAVILKPIKNPLAMGVIVTF